MDACTTRSQLPFRHRHRFFQRKPVATFLARSSRQGGSQADRAPGCRKESMSSTGAILRFFIIFSVVLFPSPALASFSDVYETHEHFAAVQWMEARSVITGYDDGTFRPEQTVNRAEALKIILLASGVENAGGEQSAPQGVALPDVKPSQWFYPYVQKALELKIVSGYPDGTFRPERSVNLAEALKMLYLTQSVTLDPAVSSLTTPPYHDVPTTAWFASYAADAKAKHLIEARSDGDLHPDWPLTRGDLTEFVYRFSYIKNLETTAFPVGLNWPLVQHPTQPLAFKVPFGWEVIWGFEEVGGDSSSVILWHRDTWANQTGWDRTTPNSAVMMFSLDSNPENLSQIAYFDRARKQWASYGTVTQTNTVAADDYQALLMEYSGPYESMRDLIVAFPENKFVAVHTTYGNGPLSEQLKLFIDSIHSTIQWSPPSPAEPVLDSATVVTEARKAIQVDGQGMATLELFPDLALLETDTLGVGTGPVDYFYSAWANVTLKYERSYDVILDIQEGQTTAF